MKPNHIDDKGQPKSQMFIRQSVWKQYQFKKNRFENNRINKKCAKDMESIGQKLPKPTVSAVSVIFLQQLHRLVYGHSRDKKCKPNTRIFKEITNLSRGLQALFNKVISQPLNHHVTLSWSHRFFIDAEDQSLASFLYSYATRALQINSPSHF